jgi:quercetin dioxygenase-like cupin family protein
MVARRVSALQLRFQSALSKVPLTITLLYKEMPAEKIREGAERRLGHTDNLMIVVVDFYDGPKDQPDPLHSHPHEQVSYVAAGEVLFVMDGQQTRLGPGDMFLSPPGNLIRFSN